MMNTQTKPVSVYLLLILMGFQGLSGLAGGFGLISDPTGQSLRIPLAWLQGSPFSDYSIPGWILLTVLGVFPLIVLVALLKKTRWSWYGALLVGLALVIWIGVEIAIIGYQTDPPLQLIYGVLGLLILALASLPALRDYYTLSE